MVLTVRATGRVVLPKPLVVLVKAMESLKEPGDSEPAEEFSEAVTVTFAPGASVPPVDDRSIHGAVFAAVHAKGMLPRFVRVNACDDGLNGPCRGPVAVRPVAGETPRLAAPSTV